MNQKIVLLVIAIIGLAAAFPIDLDVNNKLDNGTSIYETTCNKDTQIDFFFSSDSILSMNTQTPSLSGASKSKMKFLDVLGNDLELTLRSATFTNQNLVSRFDSFSPKYFYLSFVKD